MHKPLHLLAALCCTLASYAQKTDTLVLFYKPDQYSLSKPDQQKLDSFLLRNWDRIVINGYTDETESDEYNIELSKKRSGEVHKYFLQKNYPLNYMSSQSFGESRPQADNSSDNGRALNRRTEIIGVRFFRASVKPAAPATDLMLPVTKILDNGFIITYRPGLLPQYMAENFEAGSGSDFRLITNTMQMRQNNLYNNTTNGEILSSVLIICGQRMDPCNLDSAILIKVPLPAGIKCPISKVKFFNAVAERGKLIWQEETRLLTPDTINGMPYIGVWMNNFCGCINFDFKIDPGCFDIDSTRVFYTNGTIKNLTTELQGLNSVYMPGKLNDSTHSVVYLKNQLNGAPVSFALYKDKKRIKGYKDKRITDFPYDEASSSYWLSSGSKQFYFPRLDVWDVVLTVNGDRYRVPEEKNRFNFTYLQYKTDSILVDFTITGSKRRETVYRNLPLSSLPYDEAKGYYVIDKMFLKELNQKTSVAGR
ncbi:MAG: OmpA family protein [Bacteroidota bacterium]